MVKNLIKAIELTSIDASIFTGNYQAVNADGLEESCVLIRIINDTNVDVTISYDGVLDHDYIIAGGTFELNLQANNIPNGYVSMLQQGTIVYIAGVSGTGYVYLAGYYNPKN